MSGKIDWIRSLIQRITTTTNFGQCMKGIKILSADNGRCKAEFKVNEEHLNIGGSMHGGFTATVIDCMSTYALMTHEKNNPGVSVDMHITYMKPAFPGELVTVEAKTIRVGRTLAFLVVELSKNDGKDMIAHGAHTKYVA